MSNSFDAIIYTLNNVYIMAYIMASNELFIIYYISLMIYYIYIIYIMASNELLIAHFHSWYPDIYTHITAKTIK